MKKEHNTKIYFEVSKIADTVIEELKIGVNMFHIKENLEILKDFDLSATFGQLIKDTIAEDFTDEQIKKIADSLENGYTTFLVPILNYENRERTPEYNKALRSVVNSVSAKLNSQTAKEQFIAEETKHGDDVFEGMFGMSPEKFYDTARDLFNSLTNGKTSTNTSEKKVASKSSELQ